MPELPEVETTRRGISSHVINLPIHSIIVRQPQLRWPVPHDLSEHLSGKQIRDIERRGKYLLLHFKHGTALWHLGMSGNLRIVTTEQEPGKHDHIDWVFNGNLVLRFNDPRRFGALLWTTENVDQHPLIKNLGPEPLSKAFDTQYLFDKTRKSTQPVKLWIMNAKNVVGVGNIYANESLFLSNISPLKPANCLSLQQCELLTAAIKNVLDQAIESGGTTLRDFAGGDGKPGYFAQKLNVYGRGGEACNACKKELTEVRLGQRTTVYCASCQG